MNCQEALRLLYEIIDKEASEVDVNEVRRHTERCRHCFEVYRLEQAIHDFINEKLKDGNPSHSLQHLREKVSLKLDEIDGQPTITENHPFFRRTAAVMAAAAALMILVGGSLWLRDYYHHRTVYSPLEQAHHKMAGQRSAVADQAGTFAAILRVRGELGYDLSSSVRGFSLIGGQNEQIMGITMAHFVYSRGSDMVSVFIAPSERLAIPEALKDSRVERGQMVFYDHICSGCRLVYHEAGLAVVITAAHDSTVPLLDFLPGKSII